MVRMFAVAALLSRLTNTVRQPAVEERLVRGAALGEAQIAFALQRLECAEEHVLAAALAANREEAVERGEGSVPDAPVGHEVGIIAAVAGLPLSSKK